LGRYSERAQDAGITNVGITKDFHVAPAIEGDVDGIQPGTTRKHGGADTIANVMRAFCEASNSTASAARFWRNPCELQAMRICEDVAQGRREAPVFVPCKRAVLVARSTSDHRRASISLRLQPVRARNFVAAKAIWITMSKFHD
jgi:hypothetical protein